MEQLNFNHILGRNKIYQQIEQVLLDFEKNKSDLTKKRGIYIYGAPGSGKTKFILLLLKNLNYDIIRYDAGDIRNKSIIETITKHTMADKNIVSLFHKKAKPIAIVMDEIDGMNNGDKGGINSLIKINYDQKKRKNRKRRKQHIILLYVLVIIILIKKLRN